MNLSNILHCPKLQFPVFLFRKFSACILVLSMIFLLSACGEEPLIEGTVHDLSDLPGKNIGVLAGSQADLYATDLELPFGEEEPSVIIRYNSLNQAIEDLKTGTLDCIIMDADSAEKYCNANEHLVLLEEAFSWQEYSICLGAGQRELALSLNQALAMLEEEGILKQISDRYITTENTVSDPSEEDSAGKDSEKDFVEMDSEEAGFMEAVTDEDTNGSSEISDGISGIPDAGSGQFLSVATSSGFPPYSYYDENGELAGIDIDIAYALAEKLGMDILITDMDYESLFTSVTDGTADFAIAGISPSEDLMDTCIFTDSYSTACQMVLVRE